MLFKICKSNVGVILLKRLKSLHKIFEIKYYTLFEVYTIKLAIRKECKDQENKKVQFNAI